MLTKLIKFEFKSTVRLFATLMGAEILIAFILGVSAAFTSSDIHLADYHLEFAESQLSFLVGIFAFMFVAIIFTTLILIFTTSVQRYKNNLLGGQGYLMHTLPVSTWQLVLSKVIVFIIYIFIYVLANIISLFSFLIGTGKILEVLRMIDLAMLIKTILPYISLELCQVILTGLLSATGFLLLIYLCYAVGNIFSSHRKLAGALTFVAIGIILPSVVRIPSLFGYIIASNMYILSDTIASSLIATLLSTLAYNILLFAANVYILHNHLNLE